MDSSRICKFCDNFKEANHELRCEKFLLHMTNVNYHDINPKFAYYKDPRHSLLVNAVKTL